MYHGDESLINGTDFPGGDVETIILKDIQGYRSDTITQASRLYAACYVEGYLMTGDIDLIPLSDYWYAEPNEKTVWGHDLTGYGHYPICFVGMEAYHWREVMRLNSNDLTQLMKRDLVANPNAHEDAQWEKRWFHDQDLITQRLKPYHPTIVKRGQYANGYAYGRVDRGSWSLDHKQFIDAHLPQQVYHKGREKYFEDMMTLLHFIWPKEDFGWFYDYHMEFKRLTNQL